GIDNLPRGSRPRTTTEDEDRWTVAAVDDDSTLTAQEIKKRTQPQTDWQNVLFTDESTFTTRWDQRQRIWRADNTS
ncbi:hypothetical protein HPB47_010070, partial [Ixodes persulcatus]